VLSGASPAQHKGDQADIARHIACQLHDAAPNSHLYCNVSFVFGDNPKATGASQSAEQLCQQADQNPLCTGAASLTSAAVFS
jgi:hypothetical protein